MSLANNNDYQIRKIAEISCKFWNPLLLKSPVSIEIAVFKSAVFIEIRYEISLADYNNHHLTQTRLFLISGSWSYGNGKHKFLIHFKVHEANKSIVQICLPGKSLSKILSDTTWRLYFIRCLLTPRGFNFTVILHNFLRKPNKAIYVLQPCHLTATLSWK